MFSIKNYLGKGLSLMLSTSLSLFPFSSSIAKKSNLPINNLTYRTTNDSKNITAKYVQNSIDFESNFPISDNEETTYGQSLQNLDEINDNFKDYGEVTS